MEVIIDLDNNSFKGIVGDINEKVKTSINSSLKWFCHEGEQRNRVETHRGWRVGESERRPGLKGVLRDNITGK